jgi:hypothetical protein
MKFYLTPQNRAVVVLTRMKEDDGKVGDYIQVILPGEDFNGIPFRQLHSFAENNGLLEIEENLTQYPHNNL